MSAVFYRANEKTRSLNELFDFCSVEVKKNYIFPLAIYRGRVYNINTR